MAVEAGSDFTATLVDPGGLTTGVGARVEVPVTRAIVSYWRAAALDGDTWSVTLDAPLLPGDYELVWRTNDPDPPEFETFVPLEVVASLAGAAPVPDFPPVARAEVQPTVDDVARFERNRTIEAGGNDAGTFTANTRPTAAEVTSLIDEATDLVLVQLPDELDPGHYGQIRRAVAIQTALLVEDSYYRGQGNDQAATRLTSLLATLVASLNARITTDYEETYAADQAAAGRVLA